MGKQKAEVVIPAGRLWPNTPWGSPMAIEVFGATGEFSTGKTILGLSIAPGVHPEGHPFAGKPRTLYLDLEKSGTSYAGTGCKRIDVPTTLAEAYGPNYTAKQAAEWFNAIPIKVQPGQYDVCMVDPINDIESGEVDIVKANPTAYGYSKNQIDSSVGLLMAAMKAHYKKLLMGFARVFQCVYFATHLRDEFRGGKPSGRREPRGKETLAELASLYLWLERLPDDKGNTSPIPSAIVLKHRLSDTRVNESGELDVVELMPRRIPAATVRAIRAYIANPPNIVKPAVGEAVIEKPVSEVEMQTLKLHTAEAQAAAAQAQAALVERQKELAALRGNPATTAAPATPARAVPPAPAPAALPPATKPDPTPTQAEVDAAKATADARIAASAERGRELAASQPAEDRPVGQAPPAANGRVERFKRLLVDSHVDPQKIAAAMQQHGAQRFTELSTEHQDALLIVLQKAADAKDEVPF
jgi:hypothetical protein